MKVDSTTRDGTGDSLVGEIKERRNRRGVLPEPLDAISRPRPLKGAEAMGLCSTSNKLLCLYEFFGYLQKERTLISIFWSCRPRHFTRELTRNSSICLGRVILMKSFPRDIFRSLAPSPAVGGRSLSGEHRVIIGLVICLRAEICPRSKAKERVISQKSGRCHAFGKQAVPCPTAGAPGDAPQNNSSKP